MKLPRNIANFPTWHKLAIQVKCIPKAEHCILVSVIFLLICLVSNTLLLLNYVSIFINSITMQNCGSDMQQIFPIRHL